MTEQPTFHTSHVAFQLFLNSLQGYLQRNNILISVTAMQLAILITELPQVSVELNPTWHYFKDNLHSQSQWPVQNSLLDQSSGWY